MEPVCFTTPLTVSRPQLDVDPPPRDSGLNFLCVSAAKDLKETQQFSGSKSLESQRES